MKDNEKQIEEMKNNARIYIGAVVEKLRMDGCELYEIDGIVENILNYITIPEGSVVLSREEHQKYCAYKIIEPQIKGCFDRERELEKQVVELEKQRDRQAYIAEDLIQEKHRWTEQASKETAKKIIHDLDMKVSNYAMVLDLPELPEKLRFIPTEVMVHFIKTLKEQFDVEIKEN